MKLLFTVEAGKKLRGQTAVHDELAFIIDNEPVLHLIVLNPIGSEVVVSGNFEDAEVKRWIARLDAPARKRQRSRKT
jgi:hypothetical protein